MSDFKDIVRLGHDAFYKDNEWGGVANLNMAQTKNKKVKGEWEKTTIWWIGSCWKEKAQACKDFKKGDELYVAGDFKEGKDKDGNRRTEISIHTVRRLEPFHREEKQEVLSEAGFDVPF